jgi:hypothetical protein
MRPLVTPFLLLVVGVFFSLFFMFEDELLSAALSCVIAGIGWAEFKASVNFNEDTGNE